MSKIKVAVIGAAGRMGQRLVANIMAASDMELAGALEMPQCAAVGTDSGILAGAGANGIPITADPKEALEGVQAIINFSTSGVVEMTRMAAEMGASSVIGTTALSVAEKKALARLAKGGARIVFAPNMSVGVNLLFHLAGMTAKLLGDEYDIEVVEMHHNLKKDAPSGTAVRLGEILADARGLSYKEDVRHGRSGITGERPRAEIGMHALRGGDVVGDHTVIFAVGGERVELSHKASSRDTFAKGALRAVRFLATAAPGLYDMQDVLKLK